MSKIEKKAVLITGGSRGLGKEIAALLANGNKYQVVILSSNEEELMQVAKDLGCAPFLCDVSDHAQVKKSIEEIVAAFGKIDYLVSNAGIYIEGNLENNSFEEIRKVIEVNTLGTIYFTRAVLPFMKKQGGGKILIVNSVRGLEIRPRLSVYIASKWALTGFVEALRQEVADAKNDIFVMGLFPGGMKTKLFEKTDPNRNLTYYMDPKEVAKVAVSMLENDSVEMSRVIVRDSHY